MAGTIVITGLDELTSALVMESEGVAAKASDVVGKVAQHVKDTARSLAPRGPTGELADSISVTAIAALGAGSRTSREIGPTVRYASFVEFGTYKDRPQPFMGPAADRHETELATELQRVIGEL